LFHSLLDYEHLPFHCPLVNAPQLNTQLLNSVITEYRSPSQTVPLRLSVAMKLTRFVAAVLYGRYMPSDLLPSNGHIHHNIYNKTIKDNVAVRNVIFLDKVSLIC
jgi:hypothetical protein